jgi:hypothetical protein
MSKIRDLPQTTTLADDDLLYAVEYAAGPNGGRSIKKSDLKTSVAPSAAETKAAYESNPDTNDFTDAEKSKLAGIEAGATADQNASEVPYDDTTTLLGASNVQIAIEKLDVLVDFGFSTKVVSGLILSYTEGRVTFDGIFSHILGGAIVLAPNITDGYVYVDVDTFVKQTGSGIVAPPYTVPIATFTTNATDVLSLTDIRTKVNQTLVRGLLSDVGYIGANNVKDQGNSKRLADADHDHDVLTGPAVGLSPASTNTTGTGDPLARADHTHQIATALVADITTIQPDDIASAGTANTYSRGDHKHAIASAIPSTQNTDQSNSEGVLTSFARADHIHNIPTAAPTDVGSTNSQGSASTFVKSDHVHKGLHSAKANSGTQRFGDISLKNGNGVSVVDDGSGNFTIDTSLGPNELVITQGTGLIANYTAGRVRINGTTYSISAGSLSVALSATNGRIYVDVDGVVKSTTSTTTPPNAIPLAIFSSSGSAITALSENRTLLNPNITFGLSGDIASLTPDIVAAAGSTNKYADAGHIHNIPGGTPSATFAPSTINAKGVAASFALSDHTHTHAIALDADVSTISPDDTASTGAIDKFSKAGHKHAIVTSAAVSISTSTINAKGTGTAFARNDHTHAVSVSNQEATATVDDTTTSLTDLLINSMTQTPAAGTYLVMFSGSIVNSANGAERTWISLYLNGSQVSATERSIGTSGGAYVPSTTFAIITTPGAQAIEVRWRVAGGTSTVHSRRLTLLKLA